MHPLYNYDRPMTSMRPEDGALNLSERMSGVTPLAHSAAAKAWQVLVPLGNEPTAHSPAARTQARNDLEHVFQAMKLASRGFLDRTEALNAAGQSMLLEIDAPPTSMRVAELLMRPPCATTPSV